MATVKLIKKSVNRHGNIAKAAPGDPVPNYVLQDNEDGSFNVFGVSQGGSQVNIEGVATLTPEPTSDNESVYIVGEPEGMLVKGEAVVAGNANVTVVATWNDGSIGPFTIMVPVTVNPGPAAGLLVVFGTPTIRA